MLNQLSKSRHPPALARSIAGICVLLIVANLGAWMWAVLVFRDQPLLLGTALIAYTFGLRHAADADHIAAIDNATRKLMQEGKQPIALGFYFSLGHSSVVLLVSLVVYLTASALQTKFSAFREVG